jgi:hypothetical protein
MYYTSIISHWIVIFAVSGLPTYLQVSFSPFFKLCNAIIFVPFFTVNNKAKIENDIPQLNI